MLPFPAATIIGAGAGAVKLGAMSIALQGQPAWRRLFSLAAFP